MFIDSVLNFAHVLERVQGAMVRLGVRAPHWEKPRPIHTANFDLDESALVVGVVTLAALAIAQHQAAAAQ